MNPVQKDDQDNYDDIAFQIKQFSESTINLAVNKLIFGQYITKYSKSGTSKHKVFFYIQEDGLDNLQWLSKAKQYTQSRICIVDINGIDEKPIEKIKTKNNDKMLCLSTCNQNISYLALEFDSNSDKMLWWQGLQYFILQQKKYQKKSSFLQNATLHQASKVFLLADKDGSKQLNFMEIYEIFQKLHIKIISKKYLKQLFNQFDKNNNNNIEMNEFENMFKQIIRKQELLSIFAKYAIIDQNQINEDQPQLTLQNLSQFLEKEQKEQFSQIQAKELSDKFGLKYVLKQQGQFNPSQQNHQSGAISFLNFSTYIFSEQNSIFNPKYMQIYQDMDLPLTDYYINSSHNTYLLSNQLTGESSIQAYINAFKRGCRCVELDCWDGESEPIIYHGHTLTSKIFFKDVIQAIVDHGFNNNPYPIILSLEVHCCVKQQDQMAQILKDILKDKLFTIPVNYKEIQDYPSPNQLLYKVLVKGKGKVENAVNNNQNEHKLIIEQAVDLEDLQPEQYKQQLNSLNDLIEDKQNINSTNKLIEQPEIQRSPKNQSKNENIDSYRSELIYDENIPSQIPKDLEKPAFIKKIELSIFQRKYTQTNASMDLSSYNFNTVQNAQQDFIANKSDKLIQDHVLQKEQLVQTNQIYLDCHQIYSPKLDQTYVSIQNNGQQQLSNSQKIQELDQQKIQQEQQNNIIISQIIDDQQQSSQDQSQIQDEDDEINNDMEIIGEQDIKKDEDKNQLQSSGKKNSLQKKQQKIPKVKDSLLLQQVISLFGQHMNLEKPRNIWSISSIDENKLQKYIKKFEKQIVDFHKQYFTRIYPSGIRLDSSNYDPWWAIMAGSQIIALNCQTKDNYLLQYLSMFQENGGNKCGYLLKPLWLRSYYLTSQKKYPSDFTVPQKVLKIVIISGQQFRPEDIDDVQDVVDPFVEVRVVGLPIESQQNLPQRSKIVKDNGFNPQFDNTQIQFNIFCPDLAQVIFSVKDKDVLKDDFLGQYAINFHCIRPGYRVVPLWNSNFEIIEHSYIFVKIDISDYVEEQPL